MQSGVDKSRLALGLGLAAVEMHMSTQVIAGIEEVYEGPEGRGFAVVPAALLIEDPLGRRVGDEEVHRRVLILRDQFIQMGFGQGPIPATGRGLGYREDPQPPEPNQFRLGDETTMLPRSGHLRQHGGGRVMVPWYE